MARYRTVKPEFWTSEQVVECSTNARLLFVGMWNFADDGGAMKASAKTLKMQVFPADDFTVDDIQNMVDELKANNLIVEYEHENVRYWWVTGWHHQRIDRPSYKFPGPLNPHDKVEISTSAPRAFVEPSPNGSRALDYGKEGKGKERKKGGAAQAPTPTPDGVDPEAWQDFDQHRRSTSKLRSTWNDLAKTKAANLLRQLTPDQQREIVDYSVTGGYPGLFPDRATKSAKPQELDRLDYLP